MRKREHFAKGGRSSEALNTCTHCGDDINANAIHESVTDDYATHHFDKEGEHIASDLHDVAPADTDHYGTHFQMGRHCHNCSRNFDDSTLMEEHLEGHYPGPDTLREYYD